MSMTNKQIFTNVFTIDGLDSEEGTFNGVSYKDDEAAHLEVSLFAFHRLSLFAAFLGLPHRLLAPSQQQSLLNLTKNFFGWRDTVSLWKNILTVPFMTLMNIILTPLKFFFNLVKVFTEFLPRLAYERLMDLAIAIRAAADQTDSFLKFSLYYLAWIATRILAITALITTVTGLQITSPNYAIRMAFKVGKNLGDLLGFPALGIAIGISVAIISLTNTVTLYLIFMPIGLKFVATKLPAAVASTLNSIGNVLEPFLEYIAEVVAQLSWVEGPYSAGFALSGIIGVATTALGYEARMLSNKFKAWWHAPEAQPVINQNILPADVNPQPQPQPVNAQPQQQMQAFHLSASPQPAPVPVVTVPSAPPLSPLRAASVFPPATVITGVYDAESAPQVEPAGLRI
jgi:hypothetical protein